MVGRVEKVLLAVLAFAAVLVQLGREVLYTQAEKVE